MFEVVKRWYLRDKLLKFVSHFKGVYNGENEILL